MKRLLLILILSLHYSCTNSTDQLLRSQKTIFWMDQNFSRYENQEVLKYVLNMTNQLGLAAKSLGIENNTNWKIHIFLNSKPNAFSAGSGNLILTSSMIQACMNEAELAAIIAHEMSHFYLEHSDSYSLSKEIEADSLALALIELTGYQLDASLTALNILYRQGLENVSDQENLNKRAENLKNLIANKINWGILDTREFRRIMKKPGQFISN